MLTVKEMKLVLLTVLLLVTPYAINLPQLESLVIEVRFFPSVDIVKCILYLLYTKYFKSYIHVIFK